MAVGWWWDDGEMNECLLSNANIFTALTSADI